MHQSGPVAGTQMAFSSRLNFRPKGQKVLILICPFPLVYLFSYFLCICIVILAMVFWVLIRNLK